MRFALQLVFLCLFLPAAFSQQRVPERLVLNFTPMKFLPAREPLAATQFSAAPFNFTVIPYAPVSGRSYEAFFCKLEVTTEQFLGFGLQFHAGDYNYDMLNRHYR